MSRDLVNSICGEMPGSVLTDPWGNPDDAEKHDAWKIGDKMFASMGIKNNGVAVKTDSIETSQMLIDVGVGLKAPYFHRSWILLPFDTDEDELRHRINASYAIIRSKLTKKVQANLPEYLPSGSTR